ncbi:MAG: deoxyribose-phosphate aldolase [Propionibacteriaceae bacterium]|jgi:deoxyribose-phosphate aldolase|nr:deoxyribose-phosphate aldolase [Propionibacteriaceae bacterium]
MIDLSTLDKWSLGKCFDHSVLPKQTREADIRAGCREAVAYNCAAFYSASTYWTPIVVEELAGTDVLVATGIDFAWGASPAVLKAAETEYAVKVGCQAVDIVINVGALKDGRYDLITEELTVFKQAAGPALTKAILEVCFLTDDEIATACKIVAEVGLDYAKTSTGQFEGPSMNQFLVMKKTLEDTPVKLKVAGVKFPRPQNAYTFILAGTDLIGTRAAVEIIEALDQMRAIGLVPAYRGPVN